MAGPGTIVVVGGSLAGIRGAEALRRLGFDGRLVFVGAEPHEPYDRPPLSKEVLRGEREPDRIVLTKPEQFAALEMDLRLGRRATALDPSAREIELEDGERIGFDGLLIATGARARQLPGTPDLAGIHVLRTLDDCLALRAELKQSPRVAVVGAGFIGAEVAASCRKLGLEVALLETLPVPLAASVPESIGAVMADVHRDQGVDLRCGVRVTGFDGSRRVEAVRLDDGSVVPADVVVVGIGVVPETEWLASSGLDLDDGVVCDETCATKVEGVVAAGDVARWPNALFGESMRVEHWTHAVEQGEAAAARLLASATEAQPFVSVPFVWSDQYDRKIQIAGRMRPDDTVQVVHGDLAERRFVALFGRGDRLVGAVALNRPRQLIACRRMIREGLGFAEALARISG
jgi:3-phenylpropionate/trans-cinnamate dioxygenase ferredoxin reductase subunit